MEVKCEFKMEDKVILKSVVGVESCEFLISRVYKEFLHEFRPTSCKLNLQQGLCQIVDN